MLTCYGEARKEMLYLEWKPQLEEVTCAAFIWFATIKADRTDVKYGKAPTLRYLYIHA